MASMQALFVSSSLLIKLHKLTNCGIFQFRENDINPCIVECVS